MPVTRIGVQAVTGSPGQIVDIDPARITATITNAGSVAVEYSTGGAWTSIAAGASASVSCDTHDLRLRRGVSGAYPAPVDIDWTATSEGEATSLTEAQARAVQALVSAPWNLVTGNPFRRNSMRLSGQSDGTNTCGNYSIGYYAEWDTESPVFTFGNLSVPVGGAPGGTEGGPTDPITVRAALKIGTEYFPLHFATGRDITLQPGQIADTLPLGITIPAGTIVTIRTTVSVASAGMKWPLHSEVISNGVAAFNSVDGAVLAASYSDLTTSGTISSNYVFAYAPIACRAALGALRSIDAIGDSINFGQGGGSSTYSDQPNGWIARLTGSLGVAVQKLALSGERAGHFIGNAQSNKRRQLMTIGGAKYALNTHGINDIWATTDTLAAIQANMQTIWQRQKRMGYKTAQTTITDYTTSTDTWATTANQTPYSARLGATGSIWPALNAWINSKPAGLDSVIRVAEAATPNGLWVPGWTADGLHPNATGHAGIAADATVIADTRAWLGL